MSGTGSGTVDRRRFALGLAGAAAAAAGAGMMRPLAAVAQATPAAGSMASGVPLSEVAGSLDPAPVWEIFQGLAQVPRPSHHEERASAWIADWATSRGLDTRVDDVGNVIVRSPATPGMEESIGVILQAHMDMVPQKTPGSDHDFLTDPIEAVVADGWVTAVDTTLGADDGIGVAIILGLLTDDTLVHGPLEGVFTVNEEDGFTGVSALDASLLSGRILINVDSEEDWVFTIGSAGGVNVDASGAWTPELAPAGMVGMKVTVGGGKGGHSGMEINAGRANAHKLLARLLDGAAPQFGVRLASIVGGERYNAIPGQATAVIVLPADQADGFARYVAEFGRTVAAEYAAGDPGLGASVADAPVPGEVMPLVDQERVIAALHGVPNGVIRMSDAVQGMVQTSTSMGILSLGDGAWSAGFLVRSAVDSERDDVTETLASIFGLAGAEVAFRDSYTGWAPNPDSAILSLMTGVYRDLFGSDPEISSVHAGLETGVLGSKIPGLDMISVGPTLVGVHAPGERLEVASVPRVYALLSATLAAIPAQRSGRVSGAMALQTPGSNAPG